MEDERVDIVDEQDNVLGSERRSIAEKKVLRYRASKVYLFHGNNLLIQQRSKDKVLFPLFWGISIAETLHAGESYSDAAARGVEEEVGVKAKELKKMFFYPFTHPKARRNYVVFSCNIGSEVFPNREEVESVEWVKFSEIEKIMGERNFVPNDLPILKKFLEHETD